MHQILLTILLATSQSTPAAPAPIPPAPPAPPPATPAHDDSGSGRFEQRTGTQDAAWLADRFKEAVWQRDNLVRDLNGRSPRTLEKFLRSPEYSTAKQMLSMRGQWPAGKATHTWLFDAPDPMGGMTTRALELEDLSGPDGYHVRATVHCYDTAEVCTGFREKQRQLLAPKPAAATGNLALRQWRNHVYAEDCTVRAVNMAQPRYPTDALREGKGGTVRVGILFNRCGNVRDSWLVQSSGHRSLDRAALAKAPEWQINLDTLPPGGLEKRMANVPIRFEFDAGDY